MKRFRVLAALTLCSCPWVTGARCAKPNEDCSHSGCCQVTGQHCFRKNNWRAACMHRCKRGYHHHEYGLDRTPWRCDIVNEAHRDCAADGENCAHLGCCKNNSRQCYQKNQHWAECRSECKPGGGQSSAPWTCREIHSVENASDVDEEASSHEWQTGLEAAHAWDCNGATCDASTLNPWDSREFKYSPHYAPTDPNKHGGPLYGEKLWLTGAASDTLSSMMGPDTGCCGADSGGGGGCGQCLLVRATDSRHPDWQAVVMKKSRCPPWRDGCDRAHLTVAVPGFDSPNRSASSVCGSTSRSDTYFPQYKLSVCGDVAPYQCDCHQLRVGLVDTPEQRRLRDGCYLFREWGWHHGTPNLEYKPVACPPNFVRVVKAGKAFGKRGVISLADAVAIPAVASETRNPAAATGVSLVTASLLLVAFAVAARRGRSRRQKAEEGLLLEGL